MAGHVGDCSLKPLILLTLTWTAARKALTHNLQKAMGQSEALAATQKSIPINKAC